MLHGLLSLVQILVNALIGYRFYLFSEYFLPWFFWITIVTVLVLSFLIFYFNIKNYKVAFVACIVLLGATLLHNWFFYLALTNTELRNLIPGAALMLLAVGSIYSIILFSSSTRHKRWLFWAGISAFSVQIILIALHLWAMNSPNASILVFIERAVLWVSAAGCFALIFYYLNFKEELSVLEKKAGATAFNPGIGIGIAIGFISIIAILLVLHEGVTGYIWQSGKDARSRKLGNIFEARLFVNDQNDTLRYRLLKPKDYDREIDYPLVVNLHHGGGMGNDNLSHLDAAEPAQLLALENNREKYPAFLFLPQCPLNSSFRKLPNHPGISNLIFQAMDSLEKEFSIDDKRRYVIGSSLGGYGTWYFIGVHPDLFAAAIPICGGGDLDMAQNMSNVNIWAFHGENDKAVPVELSRDLISAIRQSGGNPKYTEFSGAGHNIWNKVKATPGLLDWLFEQKQD